MFLHCLSILAVCALVSGYPGGAPTTACDAMFPTGHQVPAKNLNTSPYKVNAEKHTYTQGSKIRVTLSGKERIMGFFLQARDATNTDSRIGSFATTGSDIKFLKCTNDMDAVTHSKRLDVRNLTFEWTAPSDKSGTVIFYSTFVQQKDIFWVKQPSVNEPGSRACSRSFSLAIVCASLLFATIVPQ